jgi:PAS domain S-box-containing protein
MAAGLAGAGADTAMSDALAREGDLLQGLNMDFPMTLDLDLNDPSARGYNVGSNQLPSQPRIRVSQSKGLEAVPSSMAGAGAGPLPTSFGVHATPTSGSTLTEFTKRRNWSQRLLEELRDFLHILTPDGRILYVSPSAKQLTAYDKEALLGKFIVDFIHQDDKAIFVHEFNESIASGNPLRFFYRFQKADSTYIIFEAQGHPHLTSEGGNYPGPKKPSGLCRGFFMMGRPYPTKNANLLDSFLEHKIENERLTQRIADLKREEQEEAEAQQRSCMKQDGQDSMTTSEAREPETPGSTPLASGQSNDYDGMPPPAKPALSNTALTRQNLDEANASSRPDSINDKMARYEGATHLETIEMLTGLRYREGERSQGISTGDTSPALIRGDVGIAIPVDKESRGGDKKKKLKVADEYVCTDCGTLDSPEWRKGPNGPKTLCNACGCKMMLCPDIREADSPDRVEQCDGRKGRRSGLVLLVRRAVRFRRRHRRMPSNRRLIARPASRVCRWV